MRRICVILCLVLVFLMASCVPHQPIEESEDNQVQETVETTSEAVESPIVENENEIVESVEEEESRGTVLGVIDDKEGEYVGGGELSVLPPNATPPKTIPENFTDQELLMLQAGLDLEKCEEEAEHCAELLEVYKKENPDYQTTGAIDKSEGEPVPIIEVPYSAARLDEVSMTVEDCANDIDLCNEVMQQLLNASTQTVKALPILSEEDMLEQLSFSQEELEEAGIDIKDCFDDVEHCSELLSIFRSES